MTLPPNENVIEYVVFQAEQNETIKHSYKLLIKKKENLL